MVGRTAELGQMVSAFDEMLRGRAQVVSLTGEAGLGKTRLLQEWLATLEAGRRLTSVSVRHAVCSALGEQPYAVFAAFFREAYGVGPGDSLAVAREKLAAGLVALGGDGEEAATIASLLGYVLGVEAADRFRHVEPEQLKRQIFLAMRRLIERRLQQRVGLRIAGVSPLGVVEHVFTHLRLRLHVFRCADVRGRVHLQGLDAHRWLAPAALHALPQGGPTRKALALAFGSTP
jgi:hypothetical protein